MQPKRGLELGRPLSSPLLVDGSWIPASGLFIAHLAFTAYGDRALLESVLLGAAVVAAYFASVLVHGLAHIVVRRIVSAPAGPVRLFVFGDVSVSEGSGRRDVWAALAGPVASIAIGFGFLFAISSRLGVAADVLETTAYANFALAAVNLVPALPLDGGWILAGLARRRLARVAGQVFGLMAVAGGIWLLTGGPAFLAETAAGLWLVVVGIFVALEARRTPRDVAVSVDARETVGAWARPFAGRVRVDDVPPAEGGPYAVSDGGRLAGVLASGIRAGRDARVADHMVPWSSDLGVRSDTPLARALERLAAERDSLVVVVDDQGVVRGVLDEDAVRNKLELP